MTALLPVTVISGFLGAGKTTLVNRILASEQRSRIAILVNDFGAVNVDASLIEGAQGGVLSLANGCVCCSLQSDLVDQVGALASEVRVPYDHVVIETSGVSDPGQVVRALAYPQIRARVAVSSVVTVLDAVRFAALDGPARDLADAQLLAADLAIVSKSDVTAHAPVAALHEQCQRLGIRSLESSAIEAWWPVLFGAPRERPPDSACFAPVRAAAESPFESWMFVDPEPLALRAIREVLASLPHAVYRAKGFAAIAEVAESRCIVQVVGDRVDMRAAGPWAGEPATTLAFVGLRGRVDWRELELRLRACYSALCGA